LKEKELFKRWREQRKPKAREEILEAHLRLVIAIAVGTSKPKKGSPNQPRGHAADKRRERGFLGYGLPIDDLISEGNAGLVKALVAFNPDDERGARFATYARGFIRGAIMDYILRSWSIIHVPKSQKKIFFKLRREKERINALGNGDLKDEQV